MTMETTVRLALMAKANLIFAGEDTFLSFPALEPISYDPEDLRFARGLLETSADWLAMSEFARTVNRIPRGPLYETAGDLLWDVWRQVLDTAERAGGAPSAAEAAEIDRALAFLYVSDGEGPRQESEAVRLYRQYRDATLAAEENYKSRQISAAFAEDPADRERWTNIEEPVLRAQVAQFQADWAAKGFKAEVEVARRLDQAGTARQAQAMWEEWRRAFIPDLDMPADVLLNDFATTTLLPGDVAERDDWLKFSLTGAEIQALAQQAPPELQRIFGTGGEATEIESLSFEARSVGLARPWLKTALFQARFWRFPDRTTQLSDGSNPAQGLCPAYPAAIVFARNLEVRRRAAGPGTPPQRVPPHFLFKLAQIRAAPAAMVAQPAAGALARRPRRASETARAPAVAALRGRPAALVTRLSAVGIRASDIVAPPSPPAVEEPLADELSVLAFICKRLPKSPDPDPALRWPP